MVAVISVDAYPFLSFSDLTCHLEDTGICKHNKKLSPYLFQNYVALYFESYWKRENAAEINFWSFIKLKD